MMSCINVPVSVPIVIPILSFKGTTNAYLLKMPIKHNKNLFPLLNFLVNCTPNIVFK